MYPSVPENHPQLVDELGRDEKRPQLGDDFEMIFYVPWGHNRTILDKCKGNPEKALFYVRKTLENNWSRAVLMSKNFRLNEDDADCFYITGKDVYSDCINISDRTDRITRVRN